MEAQTCACGRGRRFLDRLCGISDPETKRKIIGEEFIRVFEEEAKNWTGGLLVQGTIYPDVIESGLGDAVIKKSSQRRRPSRLCGL